MPESTWRRQFVPPKDKGMITSLEISDPHLAAEWPSIEDAALDTYLRVLRYTNGDTRAAVTAVWLTGFTDCMRWKRETTGGDYNEYY